MYHKIHKNNQFLRNAMYNIYDKKCCYCKEFISPKNMQVDHILASRSKKSNDIEFNDYLDELSKDDFELDSIENYYITCPYCNDKKNNNNFSVRNLRYFHEDAKNNAEKVYKLYLKFKEKGNDFPNYSPTLDDWTLLNYDNQNDFTNAIYGYRLTCNDVNACPRLPQVEIIKKRISTVNYCFVSGESGIGKSISIYQAAYDFHNDGWKIYKFKLKNHNNYKLPSFPDNKNILIVDDSQNILSEYIEELILQTNNNLKIIFGCTVANVEFNSENIIVSKEESIKTLTKFYNLHEIELTSIVSKIDNDIGNDTFKMPLSSRIKIASEQKTPWEFNYVIRGGWKTIKTEYEIVKSHNNCEILAAIISLVQILFLDKSFTISEIKDYMNIYDNKIIWNEDDIKFLINKKWISSFDDLRIIHLESAKRIFSIYITSNPSIIFPKLRDFLSTVCTSDSFSFAGLIWINDVMRSTNYCVTNIFSQTFIDTIFNKINVRSDTISDEEKGYILYLMERLFYSNYHEEKTYYVKLFKDKITEWISHTTDDNVYAYAWFINGLYNVDKELFNEITLAINYFNILAENNKINIKNAYSWGHFFNRIYMNNDSNFRLELYNYVCQLTKLLQKKVTKININYFLYYLSEIYYIDFDNSINNILVNKIELKHFCNENTLFYIELFSDHNLRRLIGFDYFTKYKPNKNQRKLVKEILKFKDDEKILRFIEESFPRYWNDISNFFYVFSYFDDESAKKLAAQININNNPFFEQYIKKTDSEFHYLFNVSFYGDSEKNKQILLDYFDDIEELSLPVTESVPEIAIKLFENGRKILLFESCWASSSLSAIKKLFVIDKIIAEKILYSNIELFIKELEEISVLTFDNYSEDSYDDLFNYFYFNYEDYFTTAVNSINWENFNKHIEWMLEDSRFKSSIKKKLIVHLKRIESKIISRDLFNQIFEKVKKHKFKQSKK